MRLWQSDLFAGIVILIAGFLVCIFAACLGN
jgi:hypothetical protein